MGKKNSRKGKAAWRKNIPSDDLEELVEREGREERTGGPLASTANEALFFVDKSGDLSVQKKTLKHRNKVLHCDSVLQRSSLVPGLPASNKRKLKDRDVAKPAKKKKPLLSKNNENKTKTGPFDLWGDEGNDPKKKKRLTDDKSLTKAPAVEIDAPGCSYNPSYEDHQEALGVAVAQEMQQVYKAALQPEPVTLLAPERPVDEEEMFFLEADDEDVEEDEEEETGTVSRPVKVKKLTRADLNKRARKLEQQKVETKVLERKKISKELERLPEIQETIQLEEEEQEELRTRRMIAKKERREREPPRLGKHRYKPDPMKVLLTEEVTGSLRKLKGCYSLLRDRYKSLQRRGIVEPRVPIKKKGGKMWLTYQPGTKGAKERASHAALQLEVEARKQGLAMVGKN